jgi:hypothetical protein
LIHWRYGAANALNGLWCGLLISLVFLVTRVSGTSSRRSLMRIRCFAFRLIDN